MFLHHVVDETRFSRPVLERALHSNRLTVQGRPIRPSRDRSQTTCFARPSSRLPLSPPLLLRRFPPPLPPTATGTMATALASASALSIPASTSVVAAAPS